MFLKYDEVLQFLKAQGIYTEQTRVIWATIRTGGTGNAYFLIAFSGDHVAVISVSAMGKLEDILENIAVADIQSCHFKKKMLLGYRLDISTAKDTYTFHVNKAMLGTKWHKENFEALLNSEYPYITYQ